VVIVLLVVGVAVLQFLPPTSSKDPRVDPDKQIFVKLQLHSVPAGAEIWLGGNKQDNTTPAELSVRIGKKVQIQIRKEGFLPHLYSWTATADMYQNIPLQPLPRPIASVTPNQGTNTPNQGTNTPNQGTNTPNQGNNTNTTPNNTNNGSGLSRLTPPPRPKPRTRRPRQRTMPAAWGGLPTATLTLRTNPPGATVLVDGRPYRGKTPVRVVLIKGKPAEIRLQLYGHNDAYFTWSAENDEVKDNIKLYRLSWYTPR
jgi:hypothetical protein